MKELHERLKQLIDYHKLSDRKFASEIGIPVSTLYTSKKRESDLPSSVISAIASKYPQLNLRWLLVGDGSMFIEAQEVATKTDDIILREYKNLYEDMKLSAYFWKEQFEVLQERLKESEKEIDILRKKLNEVNKGQGQDSK